MHNFRNLAFLLLMAILILSGCSLKEASAKAKTNKDEQHASLAASKQKQVFQPKVTIAISPLNYNSTKAAISVINRKVSIPEIQYHIWRTADGPGKMKVFSAKNSGQNFSFLFNVAQFLSERGEYQIEAYGVNLQGKEELLGKSSMTFQQNVPILMYHAIDVYKGAGLKELFVTPVNFEAQMRYLRDNGYTFLTFEHWDEINKVNKPVFVTFDDGMANNMNAYHILEKLKTANFQPAATEFMIAGRIDSGSYSLTSDNLKEMSDSGIFSIQSHTMTHTELPMVTNYQRELEAAKEKIQQVTGKPVIAIAYPSGKYNAAVVQQTNKYYRFAVTTRPGKVILTGQPNENLLLHRIRISNSTTLNQFAYLVK